LISIEDWLRPIKIDLKNVDKNDLKRLWMYEANILHLAAKFNPNGLFLILSHFKEHYPNHRMQQMIKDFPSMFGATPLHVAASNPDSLSTRYNRHRAQQYICWKTIKMLPELSLMKILM